MNLFQIQTREKKSEAHSRRFLMPYSQANFLEGRNIVLKLNFNTWGFLLYSYLMFLGDERIRIVR